jgi:hypothetical protein
MSLPSRRARGVTLLTPQCDLTRRSRLSAKFAALLPQRPSHFDRCTATVPSAWWHYKPPRLPAGLAMSTRMCQPLLRRGSQVRPHFARCFSLTVRARQRPPFSQRLPPDVPPCLRLLRGGGECRANGTVRRWATTAPVAWTICLGTRPFTGQGPHHYGRSSSLPHSCPKPT